MGDQARSTPDSHVGSDHAIGANLNIVGELGSGVDASGVGNQSGHGKDSPQILEGRGAVRGTKAEPNRCVRKADPVVSDLEIRINEDKANLGLGRNLVIDGGDSHHMSRSAFHS